jgi:polar amino acid transport system permease protein
VKVLYGYSHLPADNMTRESHTIMPRLGTMIFNHRMGCALILIFIISVIAGEAIAAEIDKPGIFATVLKWLPLIFKGFLMNLLVSVLSMTIGTISGVALGVGLVSLINSVRKISWFLTQFFRNAPWLVLVFYTIALIPFEVKIGPYFIPFPGWLKATIGLSNPLNRWHFQGFRFSGP